MKNLIFLLVFGFSQAQFFENPTNSENSESFESTPSDYSDNPDQGTDAREDDDFPTGPGEVPINQWTLLLPLAGLVVGGYRLLNRKKETL